jgi:hypothetical protein
MLTMNATFGNTSGAKAGQYLAATSVSGNENTNPGKKKFAPTNIRQGQLLSTTVTGKIANLKKCTPNTKAGTARNQPNSP